MASDTVTKTTSADTRPRRWPKHAVWIGLATAIGNLLLYFGYIAYVSPGLRDVPWINLPLSWLSIALATAGVWYVFKQERGALKKGLATTGFMLTLFFAGLFNWYVLSYSYTLPESSAATAIEVVAPEFELKDHKNQSVSLSDHLGKKVVLVFYRGDW